MDSKEYREAAKEAIDEIADYFDTISSRKVVSSVQPGYLKPLIPSEAPLDGEPWHLIQKDIQDKILPGITHWQSPNFMAFFPCNASFTANVADMYSNAFTGAHFNWICSPAATELEIITLDWMAKALDLPNVFLSDGPTRGGGTIMGTASESILTVMVAARDKYLSEVTAHLPEGEEKEEQLWKHRSKLVAIASSSVHSSTKKAAQILGVRFATVPVSEKNGFALQGEDLAATIAELTAKGLEPFFLTAAFGTTDVCAVDDFAGIVRALEPRAGKPGEVWVHVDAAYAGAALFLEEYRSQNKYIENFHSFNLNPHKWMAVSFDCSALWVRSRSHLISAFSISPPYLRNQFSDNALVTEYRDWGVALGRRFRSLKLWAVLRNSGIRGLQTFIRHGIDLAEGLEAKLVGRSDLFTIFTKARFGLVTFRCVGENEEQINLRTMDLYEAINADGKFYLTSTVLDQTYFIRVVTTVATGKEENVQALFDKLVEILEKQIQAETAHT